MLIVSKKTPAYLDLCYKIAWENVKILLPNWWFDGDLPGNKIKKSHFKI